jgi:hypothetical protein
METQHESVRAYIAARERGDRAETERLKHEAIARFKRVRPTAPSCGT